MKKNVFDITQNDRNETCSWNKFEHAIKLSLIGNVMLYCREFKSTT